MSDDKATTVLVTGAAGHLGSCLVPMLVEDGFVVRGLDMQTPAAPLPEACTCSKADLSDRTALRKALEGVGLIVHCAAIHPWKQYTDDQYLDANVKGTWHLYALAAEMGIDRIVLTSSIAAIGYSDVPQEACPIKEDAQFPLSDLYSYTKHTQETIARMYAGMGRIRTFAMRPPAFMPHDPRRTCIAMTGSFAVVSDIAAAHLAAARVMAGKQEPGEPVGPFEAFNAVNHLPYTAEDHRETGGDRKRLAEKYWPDACEWLAANGHGLLGIATSYDISKAERILGWRPLFNFEEAYAALRGSG
ncbi:MAG: NAD(P)-dependent oxidoreductase [Planctomycetota bacterium]